MRNLLGDIRLGCRMLIKDAGSSLLAVVSTALGIAAVTSIFSVVHAVLFDPFPYRDYDRMVSVGIAPLKEGQGRGMLTIPEFQAIRERGRTVEDAFAMGFGNLRLSTAGGDLEYVSGKLFSSNAFEFLGVKPLLGRTFLPDDYGTGAAPRQVIVLSYLLWKRRFGGDPNIPGKEVQLNGGNYTVIGVMPERFTLYTNPSQPAIWLPLPSTSTPPQRVLVHARLKPGATIESASADLQSVLASFAEAEPRNFPPGGFKMRLTRFSDWVRPWIRTTVYVLLAAVGFLLLIACCNVANLLLARSSVRKKEISIRLALGARRWHLVQQLLTESVLLSVIGGCAGVVLAIGGTRALVTLLPPNAINSEMEFRVNSTVLAASFAVAVLTGLLFGLIPAFHSFRTDLTDTLKDAVRGSSGGMAGHWTRNALIVFSVSFSMILLTGAGLMIRTFVILTRDSFGIRKDHVLTMWLPGADEGPAGSKDRHALHRSVLERLENLPGVRAATFSGGWPPRIWGTTEVETRAQSAGQQYRGAFHPISAHYFQTLGIPLLAGELFTESDVSRARHLAVINQTMARTLFPNAQAVGQDVRLALLARPQFGTDPWVRVAGVVADSKNAGPREPVLPEIFVPFTLTPWTGYSLGVRTVGEPMAMLPAIRTEMAAIDKNQPLANVRTLEEEIDSATAQERFTAVLLCVFAAIGLILASIGIYGVMSYTVSQRTREIGIRVALGAATGNVVRMVVLRGFRLICIGVLLGALGGFALTRLISNLLYGITATDPLVFTGVSAFLALVGLTACYLPGRHAATVSPVVALRNE
ncbi:MAG TPA: ABC transporter permease [Bryobacteraceae bacterium]|nr:ABC transporter permease [Bryobacteraceae bacterium]